MRKLEARRRAGRDSTEPFAISVTALLQHYEQLYTDAMQACSRSRPRITIMKQSPTPVPPSFKRTHLIFAAVLLCVSLAHRAAAADSDLPLLGYIQPRHAKEIRASMWSIGGETLDRDFAVYQNYKKYLGPLGAKGIRLQTGWAKCEKQRGVYDWAWLDAIVDDALSQGVQPWLEAAYGNNIYPQGGGTGLGGGLPKSPEALTAWDNWVRALVRRYRDRVHEWEVWNEPDLGKGNTPEEYAALFIRTAEIIRAEQRQSRIYALGLAHQVPYAEAFLKEVKQKGRLDLVDAITFHGYPRNPDDIGGLIGLRRVVASFGGNIELRQGEMGAPSRYQENFALSKIPWNENTQAKWNLRRMLVHHGNGVPFNLFTISDMHYRWGTNVQMNYKGLLGTNPDQSVSHVKLAYYAAQNVFAIFDDSLGRLTNFACESNVTNALSAFAYTNSSGAGFVTLWFRGAPPIESNSTLPVDLTFKGVQFKDPVYAEIGRAHV